MTAYDAIIIGGGAAGLFCAFRAGKAGKRVLVLEHNAQVGRKILISGGGRCNFTNIHTAPENFVSQNPHFVRSALSRYLPRDFVDLVRSHGIEFYEKSLGQLFCRGSSRQIVQMLVDECRNAGVRISTGCQIFDVNRSDTFDIGTSAGRFRSENLVIACGGLSFPKVGASGFGYRVARQFGLDIVDTRPSLVAMRLKRPYPALAGISFDGEVSTGKNTFRERLLFTHRGLSGPAILQASNYWRKGEPVIIDFDPDGKLCPILANASGNANISSILGKVLPEKLAKFIANEVSKAATMGNISILERKTLDERIRRSPVHFIGTEDYDRAEVTLGGVSTDELSSSTMECRKHSGLFFIGEVVDVTGWLGGYNFQWAWASGAAAADALRRR